MKLLFSNYLGDYSYSFQGSSELIRTTVTVSLFFFEQNAVTGKNSPREFSRMYCNYSYMIQLETNYKNVTISKRMVGGMQNGRRVPSDGLRCYGLSFLKT